MPNGYFGKALKRVEDPRLIKGIATYVDDLSLPGRLAVRNPMQWSPTPGGGFSSRKRMARRPVAVAMNSGHIRHSNVVFIDVRSASAAMGFALTCLTMVDKTRALNDRR